MKVLVPDREGTAFGNLPRFRTAFYARLSARADASFELTDALLCADGPVRTPVGLPLTAEHSRGYGSLYGALNRIGSIRMPCATCWFPCLFRDSTGGSC